MYRLHGKVRTRAMRPLWLMEELGVDYEFVPAGPRSPEALALSPLGKVPILETDDGVILDSMAQMHFLADAHEAFTHRPGTIERARQDAFSFAVLEMMDAPLWTLALHSFVLPEEDRVEAVKPATKAMVTAFSAQVAEMMAGDYAVGDAPTVADILLAHCAGWARGIKLDLDPRLLDHMHRMRDRPAFARAAAHGKDEA